MKSIQKTKFSLALIVLSGMAYTACKNKTTSSKSASADAGGSCSTEELSTLNSHLAILQSQYQANQATNGKNCDQEEAAASAQCQAGATYQSWVAKKKAYEAYKSSYNPYASIVDEPGVDPCSVKNGNAYFYGQVYKACIAAKGQINDSSAANSTKNLEASIAETKAKITACQTPRSATPTPVVENTDAEVNNGPQMSQDELACQTGGQKFGSDECNCILGEAMWQWDSGTPRVCRNYNICNADQYLGIDGKCYAKSLLKGTGQTSCPAGQILSNAGTCLSVNYQSCQSIGGILYTDGSCRDAQGKPMPMD